MTLNFGTYLNYVTIGTLIAIAIALVVRYRLDLQRRARAAADKPSSEQTTR